MNIIFINVRGLGGRDRLLSLKHLVDVENLDVLLLKKPMVVSVEKVSQLEKLFPQFCFFSVHSCGCLGGLITGLSSSLHVLNFFGGVSTLGVEVCSLELTNHFWF